MNQPSRRSKVGSRVPGKNFLATRYSSPISRLHAFTLVEIMIVIGIMGLIMAMGIPSVVNSLRKEGMRKAVGDLTEACSHARANAILSGQTAELIFHPKDRSFSVGAPSGGDEEHPVKTSGFSATFPENVAIEILGVNFQELQEADEAKVKFFSNGMSDEFTILLRSDKGEYRKISLETVTGLADVEVVR